MPVGASKVVDVGPAIVLVALLAMCGSYVFVLVRTDEKRKVGRSASERLSPRSLPRGTPVDLFVDPQLATKLAVQAIQRIGGTDVRVLDDGSAIGWIGSTWTNIPSRAPYLLAVSRVIQPDGSVVLVCSAQPRFSSQIFGGRRSDDLTDRLVAEVTHLASDFPG